MKFFSHRSSRISNFGWGLVLVPLPNRRISSNAAFAKKKLKVTKLKGKKNEKSKRN